MGISSSLALKASSPFCTSSSSVSGRPQKQVAPSTLDSSSHLNQRTGDCLRYTLTHNSERLRQVSFLFWPQFPQCGVRQDDSQGVLRNDGRSSDLYIAEGSPVCVGCASPWRSPVEESYLFNPLFFMTLPLLPPLSLLPSPPAPIGLFLQCASREGSWLQSPRTVQEFSVQTSLKVQVTSPKGQEASGDQPPLRSAWQKVMFGPLCYCSISIKMSEKAAASGIRAGEGPWGLLLLWDLQRGHSGLKEGPCPTLQTGTTAELGASLKFRG